MQTVNLAELAGIDTTGVDEVRLGELMPVGIYLWQIQNPSLEDASIDVDGESKQKLIVKVPLVATDVKSLEDASISAAEREKLIGKSHTQMISLILKEPADLQKFVGMVKAFLVDTGCQGSGKLGDILKAANGHKFLAPIKHTPSKTDKDFKFANIVMSKAKAA